MIDLKFCLQACINTYCGEHGKLKNIFDITQPFGIENVQGDIGYLKDQVYIVFQGSNGTVDWINNCTFWKKTVWNEKNIKIHTGFWNQYSRVHNFISDVIYKNIDREIIITGHSLGGALATIAGLYFPFANVITFGSPRVGNKKFKKHFDKNVKLSLRVVNNEDLVCKVPTPLMGYYHVSSKHHIGKRNFWHIFTGSTDDHKPENYLKNL